MKKIKSTTQLLGYGISALAAAGVFFTLLVASTPNMPSVRQPAVGDFSQIQVGQTVFASSSPFPAKLDLSSVPGMPGSEMIPPSPPIVPQMPRDPNGPYTGGYDDTLRVVGVLPPDVAILQRSGKTVTVKLGKETPWGTLTSVSKSGVTVGGEWVDFEK
ncbi:hypothetical protein [Phascolarctobacterium sp.]